MKFKVHRDIKLENILLKRNDDGKWIVKIADFGISKRLDDNSDTMTSGKISYHVWTAPETVTEQKHVRKYFIF